MTSFSRLYRCDLICQRDLVGFSGKQEGVEAIIAALEVIPEPFKSMATTLVDVCAYAGKIPID